GTYTGDPYLESVKNSKEEMRKLIRNERRLELCFENLRFWDLRRWQADLNETAKGVSIKGTAFTPIDVENRRYSEYMYYGPLPYSDVLKFSNLEQNHGW
ncbi:MAG: RagB/SusD family nutrient uptake outer membrane protein, partial [Duncaniella sp.]|nr:RagB/SusD family nutrient uptake outer membrane protein [Duncaniella sp.]